MDHANLINLLSQVEWGALPQPSDNAPDAVPRALLALAETAEEEAAWRAYNRLLYATGNNHAGTYYPVAIFVIPVLAKLIEHGSRWPTHAALNVLSEFYMSFEPEAGFEVFDLDGVSQKTMAVLEEAIAGLKPLIERIAADPEAGDKPRAVAQELLLAIP